MKTPLIILAILLLGLLYFDANAQSAADSAHQKGVEAVKLEDAGKFDDAMKLLTEAAKLDPGNIDYPYEMTYCYYGLKQYQKVIDVLEKLKDNPDSFDRLYELLGNGYDMLGKSEKAVATYQDGLKKFPQSGVLYLEMGVIPLFKKDYNSALNYFEKGIEVQPDFPSNYFWAAKLHCGSDDKVWGMLYGEIFINLERNSDRTAEISKLLYDTYKNSITDAGPGKVVATFSKNTVINVVGKNKLTLPYSMIYEPCMLVAVPADTPIDLNSLDKIRQNFLNFYDQKFNKDYPNALFSYQDQIVQSGNFEAYNHWLLSEGDKEAFNTWRIATGDKFVKFVKWFTDNPIKLDENNKLNQSQFKSITLK
jgi:tetratricopeptide (TPR) repeat protein